MTDRAPLPYDFMSAVPSFELRSDDVADGQMMSHNQVFDGFGITGRNISPSLSWSGFPAQTKNFAVTLFDPDAPTGSGWWHWVVLGIPVQPAFPQPSRMPCSSPCTATDLRQRSPQRAGSQPGRLASWAQQPRRHKCPLASVRRSLCRVAA
jgi:phosphatidylethanolamine-binding protein (PEBP) family uncharacterized protein